ncbi:L-cystine uptake protein TcyP (sodium:dicarboxylate symporter family) [Bacillus horti]|uniref:L-cystine uptake protein TcyP n=2 Tax=Caldalkalibacillus horti TaxID=77523 RepID=A0ABT9VTA4_9BACI|nr:L-cystine uptake protein TcyP (sodium:dicarboxylate symporter family) [Bacillus horti]
METFLVVINIAILLVFIGILFYMQRKHVSFSKRVFTGLIIGIIYGLGLQFVYAEDSTVIDSSVQWFNLVGTGYIRFLQMIVVPLIFVSILAAFTKLKLSQNLGKVSLIILVVLIGTTVIAALVGIGTTIAFDLEALQIEQGEAELARGESLENNYSSNIQNQSFPQRILQLLPANPFLDFTGQRPTSTIAVVIFTAFIGIAFLGVRRKEPELAETFAKFVDSIYAIVMRIVTLILRLTPYGILAIMARTAATSNLDAIVGLGKFVIASYVALIIVFIIHLLILVGFKLNPVTYLKKAFPVLAFAFTSRTSAGALPLTIQTQKSLGVPDGTANFAGSFGLSIGQNGCAGVYPAMLAVMIAPTVGINPLDPSFILLLLAVVAISSFGVAGVGGGATFAAILVLSTMNLPIALAGVLISVEPLIDMGRTALNVNGSMTAGLVTSRVNKELEADIYTDLDRKIEVQA